VPSLSEQQVEEAGIYMAKNRDVFAKAFKSQPDALSELLSALSKSRNRLNGNARRGATLSRSPGEAKAAKAEVSPN
jgi:dsDNA-binding SOS-regulon protein